MNLNMSLTIVLDRVKQFLNHFLNFLIKLYLVLKGDVKSIERQTVLNWASEQYGRHYVSFQEIWSEGPKFLRPFFEELTYDGASWGLAQELLRSKFALPPVMTDSELGQERLTVRSEKKFYALLKRVRDALGTACEGPKIVRVSRDLVAKGVALYAAYTGMRGVFFVYSSSHHLDDIKVEMVGPSKVEMSAKRRKSSLMYSYIAFSKGTYFLEVSKNGWSAPGSPFEVSVQDPPPGYKGNFGALEWNKPERIEDEGDSSLSYSSSQSLDSSISSQTAAFSDLWETPKAETIAIYRPFTTKIVELFPLSKSQ